jgi:phosphohistidine phosphatase
MTAKTQIFDLLPRAEKSMKTLHLLRHAKSSWKDPALDDHERPLNKRGRAAAKAMAKYMQQAKIAPDIVLCSTALRAKQTLDPIAKHLAPAKVVFDNGIYGVPQSKLWKYLWALPEQVETVLLIGHNPALHHLGLALADARSRNALPPSDGKFATGALASFRIDGPWKELRPANGHLVAFIEPRQLASTER